MFFLVTFDTITDVIKPFQSGIEKIGLSILSKKNKPIFIMFDYT